MDEKSEFRAVLTLLPIALQAVNLDPEAYPTSVEDGKDGERELHVKNQFNRTIRLVLKSAEEHPLYMLLVAKPPSLNAFVPYATKPYKVDAETLCCYLAHSLDPKSVGGGRSLSKTAVNDLVRNAIAQHQQTAQREGRSALKA